MFCIYSFIHSNLGNMVCKQNAALALANLAFNNDNMYTIVQEGAIRPLVQLLKTGNQWCKKNAGLALANLAYGATHTMAIAQEGKKCI